METIREYGGKIIGYVDTDSKGNQTVRSFYGNIVAMYDASSNTTRLFAGPIISIGNTAVGQLYNPKANPDYGK